MAYDIQAFNDAGCNLQGGGSGTKYKCPKCQHLRRPAMRSDRPLSVDWDRGVWNCHRCGFKGAVHEARRGPERQEPKPGQHFNHKEYGDPISEANAVFGWFKERGIDSIDLLLRHNIRVTLRRWDGQERLTAVFPVFDRQGDCVNIKYRRVDEKQFQQEKGGTQLMYGIERLEFEDPDGLPMPLTIVEGEMDLLAMEYAHIENVVSLPSGGQVNDAFFERHEDIFKRFDSVVLAGDTDGVGMEVMEAIARRVGLHRCRIVKWPEGCKDANDALLQWGAETLWDAVADAKPWPIDGVDDGRDLAQRVGYLYDHPDALRGISTGWGNLDQRYTIRRKQVTIVTGIPSHGKSMWLSALMVNLYRTHGWKFGVYSPEFEEPAEMMIQMLCQYVGKAFRSNGYWEGTENMTREEALATLDEIGGNFSFVKPPEDENKIMTLEPLLELLAAKHHQMGFDGVVIDPWNYIDMGRGDKNETAYVSEVMSKLKTFTKHHDLHLWLVAHPMKMIKKKDGTYPVPKPYDISGSANWYAKADNIICVWRDVTGEQGDTVEIHVQKVRSPEVGRVGHIVMSWNRPTRRFNDLTIGE